MSSDALDDNVEETVEAVAKLHQDHHQAAGSCSGASTASPACWPPPAMVLLILAVTAWILGNRFGPGWPDPDFVGLELGRPWRPCW
uniref:Uncharacterized protein n=1 Tax=Phenylobacterium glaciei TaxID=2803784 RepID=A0A974P5L3_9CAUL|nr:hypothetical protein JKL49_11105 [Phenylobacterium glaciei]